MDVPNPTVQVPVTPGYLLALHRDYVRRNRGLDRDSEYPKRFSFHSTMIEWIQYGYLREPDFLKRLPFYSIMNALWQYGLLIDDHDDEFITLLNELFGVKYSCKAWSKILSQADKVQFGDVAHFIAQRTTRPMICSLQLGPFSSRAAGAFIAIREFLREQGADADQIAPSTPFEPYAITYHQTLPFFLSKLAPGTLPRRNSQLSRLDQIWLWVFLIGGFGIFATWMGSFILGQLRWEMILFFCICLFACMMINGIPGRVYYEGIHTFRDLAFALTQEPVDHYEEIPWTPRPEFVLKEKAI
jgi:hypothetical protein